MMDKVQRADPFQVTLIIDGMARARYQIRSAIARVNAANRGFVVAAQSATKALEGFLEQYRLAA